MLYIEVQNAIHQAEAEFTSLEFIDQEAARRVSLVAEAVANMFTVLCYQAETGRATPEGFQVVLNTIRQATAS